FWKHTDARELCQSRAGDRAGGSRARSSDGGCPARGRAAGPTRATLGGTADHSRPAGIYSTHVALLRARRRVVDASVRGICRSDCLWPDEIYRFRAADRGDPVADHGWPHTRGHGNGRVPAWPVRANRLALLAGIPVSTGWTGIVRERHPTTARFGTRCRSPHR